MISTRAYAVDHLTNTGVGIITDALPFTVLIVRLVEYTPFPYSHVKAPASARMQQPLEARTIG